MKNKNKKGFTLMEMIIVVAIIGIAIFGLVSLGSMEGCDMRTPEIRRADAAERQAEAIEEQTRIMAEEARARREQNK